MADRDKARREDVLLFETVGTNLPDTITAVRGDADAAFADAPYTRREHFRVQRHAAVPMEPRGLLAEWDAARERMTVNGACKVPFTNRRVLAEMMGLPETSVRMVEYDVGGGFGARGEFYPEDFLIPFAARLLRRPIKWTEDRRENLTSLNHARDIECDLEIACDRDGTILGAARPRLHRCRRLCAHQRRHRRRATSRRSCRGRIAFRDIRIDVTLVVTNKTPVGTYRGPGRFEADFCRERLFDMAAARPRHRPPRIPPAQSDPRSRRCPIRCRPCWSSTSRPSATAATIRRRSIAASTKSTGPSARSCNGKLVDGRYHGIAVGCYLEGGGTGPRENVRLVVEADGSISVYVGSSSVGQGVETVFAQIAADALEMPMDAHQSACCTARPITSPRASARFRRARS